MENWEVGGLGVGELGGWGVGSRNIGCRHHSGHSLGRSPRTTPHRVGHTRTASHLKMVQSKADTGGWYGWYGWLVRTLGPGLLHDNLELGVIRDFERDLSLAEPLPPLQHLCRTKGEGGQREVGEKRIFQGRGRDGGREGGRERGEVETAVPTLFWNFLAAL